MSKATFTVKEAAAYLGIGRNKTYDLLNERAIPYVRIGKQFRIPIKALDRWLETASASNLEVK